MKLTTFAVRVWRAMSVLLVFAASVYSYSLFGAEVGVHFDAAGKADEFMKKSDVFYIVVGLILANNVLLTTLGKQFLKLPGHLLPIPHQEEWAASRDEFNEHFLNWIYCLVALLNTLIAMTVFALATVNNEFKYKIGDFEGLLYLVIALLLLVIVALPVRLMIKPAAEELS